MKNTIIGSALKDCDKVGKFQRTDPNPGVPFVVSERPCSLRAAIIAAVIAGLLLALLLYSNPASAQTIVCIPGPNGTVICRPQQQCWKGMVCREL